MPIAGLSLRSGTREAPTMAKPLLTDELWEIIEPILPRWTPSPKGGHPRIDDRKALTGILFVLKTGIPWEDLPWEMGCGWHDLLAPAPCLARSRRLVPLAPGSAATTRRHRPDRLVACRRRCDLRPGLRRRRGQRQKPYGSRAPRRQATRPGGRPRDTPGRGCHGGQRPGGQGVAPFGG